MTHLVIGGTGTVGGQVVRALLERGESVRVLVRSAAKAEGLPAGAVPAQGDLQKPETLDGAFAGAGGVFLLNALSEDETEQGIRAVNAAKRAGARRLVYLSVHRADEAAHIPHFATKLPVEKAIRESGLEWTILRPNNFFQNDFWYMDVIRQYGIYPQPMGNAGTSRVDVRDIAEAAVAALTQPGHSGQTYSLVGPDVLTADQTAEIYARHFGRPVRYAGDDLTAWAEQSRAMLPEWLVRDLCIMYEHFQKHGLLGTPGEVATLTAVLGHPPRSFESFVQEVAARS